MRKIFYTVAGILLASQFAMPASAQTGASSGSLDQLLDQVKSVRQSTEEAFEQRRSEFNAASAAEQAAMMKEAEARRDELGAASAKLTDTYSANEVEMSKLNKDLQDKANKLGLSGVFGSAKQVASDVSSILEQSLIGSQFTPAEGEVGRVQFLRGFAAKRTLPTTADLERVWFEIQREMTAQGEVARYQTEVVGLDGVAGDAEVIRIGPFTATSDGKFLSYQPTLGTLTYLPRQLPDEFMSILKKFEGATSGYAQAVVDQTRGVLTSLYIERPTWMERIELGEAVGYVILAVGFAGAVVFLFQLVRLILIRIAVARQFKNLDRPVADNPLGRVLLAFRGDPSRIEEDTDVAELRISEAVSREVPRLEAFQAFLRLAVASGPLLGLIGTVVGMIITFQSITETGSSDPTLMATGIGQAMIATVLGLGIAIPLLFANALLNSLSRGLIQILDEQSAGMLAESIERRRNA